MIYYFKGNTFTIFFRICLSINKTNKRKKSLRKIYKNNRNTQRCNNKKKVDEKVDAYEKISRSKLLKLVI